MKKKWLEYFDAFRKRDWGRARAVLENIAKIDHNPRMFMKLGDICRREGDAVNAIAFYHRSAELFHSAGHFHKALSMYKVILQLDEYNPDALERSRDLMMEVEAGTPTRTVSSRTKVMTDDPMRVMEEFLVPISEKGTFPDVPEIFSRLSQEELQELISELEERSFSVNDVVIREGELDDSMYIIRSGTAKVTGRFVGKKIVLAKLGEGEIFGEVAFLTGRPRTASVVAEGPLEVFEMKRSTIEKVIERHPEIFGELEDFYESRVRDAIRKVLPPQMGQ